MSIRIIGLFIICLFLYKIPKWIILESQPDVSARFLEHEPYIPSLKTHKRDVALTQQTLRAWLSDPQNIDQQRTYINPVIIPIDLLYLLAVGLLLGTLSSFLAAQVPLLETFPVWLWWAFPLAYMGFDFVEDMMIVAVLTRHDLVDGMYSILRFVTYIKLAAIYLALFQAVVLILAWGLSRVGVLQRRRQVS